MSTPEGFVEDKAYQDSLIRVQAEVIKGLNQMQWHLSNEEAARRYALGEPSLAELCRHHLESDALVEMMLRAGNIADAAKRLMDLILEDQQKTLAA